MIVNGRRFTIGADPEIFVGSKTGQFISAHNLIPGTKLNPHRVENGAVQVDGMAVEFNIDPVENIEEFHRNLDSVQDTLKAMIGENVFIQNTSVFFDESEMSHVPAENFQLGCDSDFNAWTSSENEIDTSIVGMRTVGGHLHIGGFHTDDVFEQKHWQGCMRLIRAMDEFVGVYSLLWDLDDQRRSLYGKAGCFRPKTYGVEYRTMSNRWIWDRKIREFVFKQTEKAIEAAFNLDYTPNEEVRSIIDNNDRKSSFFENNKTVEELVKWA